MPSDNVRIVEQIIDAWNTRRGREVAHLWSPDVEYDATLMPEGGLYRGLDELQEFARGWLSAWEDVRLEAEEVIETGNDVVVCLRQSGIGRASGIEVEDRFVQVFTVENGRVTRVRNFTERGEALAAVGR